MTEWQPIETAPKDRRILAYGIVGLEAEPCVSTVLWDAFYTKWRLNPSEASEYEPEACTLTHWMPLPEPPHQE